MLRLPRNWEKKRGSRSKAVVIAHAQGALMGQFVGDALGSIVEFMTPAEVAAQYPHGVREMIGSPNWKTLPGQPTDDSEMALALARSIVSHGKYDESAAWEAYVAWKKSGPFDCGMTIASALEGKPNRASQANGAMMRACPLGIYGARFASGMADMNGRLDARLTHPHPACMEANGAYAAAIAIAVANELSARDLYEYFCEHALMGGYLLDVVTRASSERPLDYVTQQGWVVIALQNALWQLLHAKNFEEALVDTISHGGDTDTNAAICGALLGAFYGIDAIPKRWAQTVLSCQPEAGKPGVLRPRPREYWPVDGLELATALVGLST